MIPAVPPVPARVVHIEQRLGAGAGRSAPTSGMSDAPLGFGLLLEQQRTSVSSGVPLMGGLHRASFSPAVQRTPGSYGPLAPPAELEAYGNGRIPTAALAPVGGTEHRLWAPAAHGLQALIAAAGADGVRIGITDSYRPLEDQQRLAAEKGLYSHGGLAAVPGTSNHGWGLSTDLDLDDTGLAWMRRHAWKYGFVEDVAREPWHWTYRPAEH